MIKIEDHIKEIIRFCSNKSMNTATLDRLHGVDRSLGIDYFDANARHIGRKNFGKDALVRYSQDLEQETLRRIVAVLYCGRGVVAMTGGSISYFWDKLHYSTHAELSSKLNELSLDAITLYLGEGLKKVIESKVDLNDLVL